MAIVANPVTDFVVGNPLELDRTITELPIPITSATITLFATRGFISPLVSYTVTTLSSTAGAITQAGVQQPDGTYTATLTFLLSPQDTQLLVPGSFSWATVELQPGPYTSEIIPLYPLLGGPHG